MCNIIFVTFYLIINANLDDHSYSLSWIQWTLWKSMWLLTHFSSSSCVCANVQLVPLGQPPCWRRSRHMLVLYLLLAWGCKCTDTMQVSYKSKLMHASLRSILYNKCHTASVPDKHSDMILVVLLIMLQHWNNVTYDSQSDIVCCNHYHKTCVTLMINYKCKVQVKIN